MWRQEFERQFSRWKMKWQTIHRVLEIRQNTSSRKVFVLTKITFPVFQSHSKSWYNNRSLKKNNERRSLANWIVRFKTVAPSKLNGSLDLIVGSLASGWGSCIEIVLRWMKISWLLGTHYRKKVMLGLKILDDIRMVSINKCNHILRRIKRKIFNGESNPVRSKDYLSWRSWEGRKPLDREGKTVCHRKHPPYQLICDALSIYTIYLKRYPWRQDVPPPHPSEMF